MRPKLYTTASACDFNGQKLNRFMGCLCMTYVYDMPYPEEKNWEPCQLASWFDVLDQPSAQLLSVCPLHFQVDSTALRTPGEDV